MINEILIINQGGLPLYHYDSSIENETENAKYILESAFFTAITQLASEMATDKIKYIVFEGKSYVLKRSSNILCIFAVDGLQSESELIKLEQLVNATSDYIQKLLKDHNILDTNFFLPDQLDTFIDILEKFLIQENIVNKTSKVNVHLMQENFQLLVHKSVGYIPGKVNIGIKRKRYVLNLGLNFLLLALIGYIMMIALRLQQWSHLLLFFPLFIGFYGLYQFKFSFSVSNAFKKIYDMQ